MNDLDLVPTGSLLQELLSRFDAGIFIAQQDLTLEHSGLHIYGKGKVMTINSLLECAHVLVKEELHSIVQGYSLQEEDNHDATDPSL